MRAGLFLSAEPKNNMSNLNKHLQLLLYNKEDEIHQLMAQHHLTSLDIYLAERHPEHFPNRNYAELGFAEVTILARGDSASTEADLKVVADYLCGLLIPANCEVVFYQPFTVRLAEKALQQNMDDVAISNLFKNVLDNFDAKIEVPSVLEDKIRNTNI